MKIDLPILMGGMHFEVVKAELIDIAPHITVGTFAVHKRPDGWGVSNVEIGGSVTGWAGSSAHRLLAIDAATRILASKTDADMLKAYRRAPKECRSK